MQMSADWGWSWTIAAYAVSWAVLLGYAHYVRTRSRVAFEALEREALQPETPNRQEGM